jgi:hypothetical protein
MAIATLVYALIYLLIKKALTMPQKLVLVMVFLTVSIAFLMTTPLFSRDSYVYSLNSKNLCLYKLNPYLIERNHIKADPWLEIMGTTWVYQGTSLYGPVFSLLTYPLGCISTNLHLTVVLYKFFNFLIFLVTGIVLLRFFDKQDKERVAFLYFLNPALLVHFVLDAHNNILGILLILLALYQIKNIKSWLYFSISVLVRYSYLIFLPVVVLKRKGMIKNNLKGALLFVLLAVISFIPFNFPFKSIYESFREVSALPCFHGCNFVRQYLEYFAPIPSFVYIFITFITYIYFLYNFLVKKFLPEQFIIFSYLVFLFFGNKWMAPWYLLLPLVISMLLSKKRGYLGLVFALTLYAFFKFFGF